jgi:hypothetical protein
MTMVSRIEARHATAPISELAGVTGHVISRGRTVITLEEGIDGVTGGPAA